jgi:SAM-dependent methyltransferase
MTGKSKGQSLLENAYKLQTPDDNKAYYDAFAATYDTDFASSLGWAYPQAIASVYHAHATAEDVPIADIGCGTGLVAQALNLAPERIDGIDISEAMLDVAKGKGLYRRVILADLLADLTPILNDYGGVVSAGTFTAGHLGPEPPAALLRIARPNALFVIGVNRIFYETAGFDAPLRALEAKGAISAVQAIEVPMYGKAGHDHSGDTAFVLCYRKCAQ